MKKKIKLIFFHPYSYIGGADNSLYRLIKNLSNKLFSSTFISLNKSFLQKKLDNVDFISLENKRVISSIFILRKIIKKIVDQNKYKKIIIVSNQNFANIIIFFSTLLLKKLKLIFIERNHTDELFFFKNISLTLKNIIIFFLIKLIYSKANRVVAISKGLQSKLKSITKTNVKLIYNPANDPEILNLSNKKINFKFDKNKKYIISVARFTKRKGIEDIVKAFYLVQKKLSCTRLLLIGYGNKEGDLKKIIKNYKLAKKVKIINNCQNPYPYIKKSDLFVFNSKYEGFANVLVESIILKTPVISTNCNSGPSEILLNGKGGVLIPVKNNIQCLYNEIIKHFSDENKLKTKNLYALSKVSRFSLKQNIKKFSKLFNTI